MTSSAKAELLDEMIADAQQRLPAIQARVMTLQSEAELEDKYLQDLIRRRSEVTPAKPPAPRPHLPVVADEEDDAPVEQTVPEVVKAILEKSGKAMRAKDVVLALQATGFTNTSKRGLLPSVLSALTRREDWFKKVKRGTYKLIAPVQVKPTETQEDEKTQ